MSLTLSSTQLIFLAVLALPVLVVLKRSFLPSSSSQAHSSAAGISNSNNENEEESKPASVMQSVNPDLAPPRDDPYTLEQLKAFDGSDESKPIYVAIKGELVICFSLLRGMFNGV